MPPVAAANELTAETGGAVGAAIGGRVGDGGAEEEKDWPFAKVAFSKVAAALNSPWPALVLTIAWSMRAPDNGS